LEDNIKTSNKEVGWESVDWIHLAQDRDWWQAVINMAMDIWVS
jgi:hypothetical protein